MTQETKETQELCLEMRVYVTTPKMSAVKLSEGVKRIMLSNWPECKVSMDEIHVVSVSNPPSRQESNEE